MLQLTGNRPLPGVMFGLTHEADGTPIIREPRILKVGIGLPRGRGLNVWLHNDRRWYFRIARKGPDNKIKFETCDPKGLASRKEAERFYRENYKKAEMVNYPRKLSYFTFTRPVVAEDGGEVFEPDFEAMEAHGPTPTEIDVVFLDDDPFAGAYQMWSTSELKCKGDGRTAMRILSMAANDEEKRLAQLAEEAGSKYFPILEGCWTNGCSYSKEFKDDRGRLQPSPCKPGGDLKFQLAQNIRVGGTAYFHTSGFRSISHIFSSLERIKTLTNGRLAGVPLKMVLRPYKTKHDGQTATQYGVGLEFRAEDIKSLRQNLMEQALKFHMVSVEPPPRRAIESSGGSAALPLIEEGDEEVPILSAQAIADEFYPDGVDHDDEEAPPTTASDGAKTATQNTTAELAGKLKAKSSREVPPEPPASGLPTLKPQYATGNPDYKAQPDPRQPQEDDTF